MVPIKNVLASMLLLLLISSNLFAQQPPTESQKKVEPKQLRTSLEEGRKAGALPEGVVIRIGACLGARTEKGTAEGYPEGIVEPWEFTSKKIHRVELEHRKGMTKSRVLESRPFDSKNLCAALLDGKAIEIEAKKGTGEKDILLGTPYEGGTRSIEVIVNGESVLELLETNGPAFVAYPETDARAFGALFGQAGPRSL